MPESKTLVNDKLKAKAIQRLAICSDLRNEIILNLVAGQKSLGDLRESLKISSTTALHALKELDKANLCFQEKNKKYSLTNVGRILAVKLLDFSNTTEVLHKHERFWEEHDLTGIPHDQLGKIGWLKNSNLVSINALDIIKPHDIYIDSIKKAKWIKGVSPLFSSDYTRIYKEFAERKVPIQLLLSDAVLEKLISVMGLDNLKYLITEHKVEIFTTNENLRVAFTVTDTFLSFGLFGKDGVYDIAHDLIGTDDMAIRWGTELFEYYRVKAKEYK